MTQPGHTIDHGPDDGEQYMSTGDIRRWLAALDGAGDDGSALVRVRAGKRGLLRHVEARIVPPGPADVAWREVIDGGQDGRVPTLPPGGQPAGELPARSNDTLTGLPVARQGRGNGGAHAK